MDRKLACLKKSIFWVIAFAAIFLCGLFFCARSSAGETAQAETYSLGDETIKLSFSYGQEVSLDTVRNYSGIRYKIISFNVSSATGSDSFFPLLDKDNRVTVTPGTYYLSAVSNVKPTDSAGNVLEDSGCSGTLRITVRKSEIPITVTSECLTKTYGDTLTALPYEYVNAKDAEKDLTITFSSEGFDAAAKAGASYPVSVTTDKPDCYSVTLSIKDAGTNDAVRLTVSPRPIELAYESVALVPFNRYLMADGESVCSVSRKSDVNDDTIICYFRMKDSVPSVLTIGDEYPIEYYRYAVKPDGEDASFYGAEESSDYAPTVSMTADTVRAKTGDVTIYQDESKIEERRSDPSYYYLSPDFFSYTYLDETVADYDGTLSVELPLYEGITVSLCCQVEEDDALIGTNLPAGEYLMSLKEPYEGELIQSLTFEGDTVRLLVNKKNVGEYREEEEEEALAEIGKVTSLTITIEGYEFRLTADLTDPKDLKVGDKVAYTSCESLTDPNCEISYGEARVTVVKRSSDISLVAPSSEVSVLYKEGFTLAVPYLNYEEEGERVLEEKVTYEYRNYGSSGSYSRSENPPTKAGVYEVICTLSSFYYEAAPVIVKLSIAKRPIALYYEVASTTKAYGVSAAFGSERPKIGLKVTGMRDCDPETGEESGEIEAVNDGDFSGTLLTSAGLSASAAVGEYDYDVSRIGSTNYVVVKAVVYDKDGKLSEKFAVVKAAQPPALDPETLTVSVSTADRRITVKGTGALQGEVADNAGFSSAKSAEGTDTLTFPGLTCGKIYYFRVRLIDGDNYESAEGVWSESKEVELLFPKPTVTLSDVTSGSARFTASVKNSDTGYTFAYRINSGDWKAGSEITGLSPDTKYSLSVRAEKGEIKGESRTIELRTLRAALPKEAVSCRFDKETGTLSVSSGTEGVEYRLLTPAGEVLSDWSAEPAFGELTADTRYLLQIRQMGEGGVEASDVTQIEIDTREPEKPFTFKDFVSDWFLLFVGGGALILLAIVVAVFVKKKNKILNGSGGKKE